ncbi:efflux RND transporter permease subunit [Natronoflexus pectinivorans]|uniref:Cobalt-zinc-cadmium resistance protein CzcA n=1 Tax=Natronoflexus pectinivorans TaxID=682526 RepID=A0A4R2GK22_9BACT|nr:CusA/CzcA family heavy metal efflux RND transporter [Natronoflexus pectinivorans]TCO09191.1 cobalt-zinc-cadmium resistance protein CzcA [Natronoflexus pectinivorans]
MHKIVNNIIAFSIKNHAFIFFMTFLVILFGVISYQNTPVEAYPDVTNTRARIIVQWSGRSADEMEKFITLPIEKEMNTIPYTREMRSISLFGLSAITLIFEDHVDDFTAQQYVSSRLGGIDLPSGADVFQEPPSGATGEIFRYVIRGENRHIRELTAIQDWLIERHLLSVPGVADVVTFGGEEKIYEIQVEPSLLARYEFSPLDVYEAVSRSNVNVGGDIIEKSGQAYVVRGIGLLDRIEDIENIIVDNINGTPILIKHLATVEVSSKPRLGQVGLDDDDDLVQGIVIMRRGENPSDVIEGLRKKISHLNERILPSDVTIKPFMDRTELIENTLSTVKTNLIGGVVLVSAFVFMFLLGWRTTLMVVIIIPVSFLFAIIMLRLQGLPANLISMGALNFGIVVDGAVVLVESIFVALDKRARQMGMEKFNRLSKTGLIKRSTAVIAGSVFFSKLILIVALIPIFAFQQVEGKMFAPLAYTVGYALLGSLLFSLTLIPAMAKFLLNKNVKDFKNPIADFIREMAYKAFSFCYKYRRVALTSVGLFFLFTIYIFRMLGTEFLPQLNEGAIYARATLPNSIALNEAVEITKDIKQRIRSFDEVKYVLTQTGRPNDGTDPTGFFNIECHIELHPRKKWNRKISQPDLLREIQEKLSVYPGVDFGFSQPIMDNVEEYVSGVKSSLVVKIFGDDLYRLEHKAEQVAETISHVEGIEDISIFRNIGQPELRILLDEVKMARHGIHMSDAQAVIEMAIGGKTANQFYEEERIFDIRVRFKASYRDSKERIANILIPSSNGKNVVLKEVADIEVISGPAFIYRENNNRYIAVGFSVRHRDLGGTINKARALVDDELNLPRGYTIEWAGEFENKERATRRLAEIIPIALLLIFFLLFMNFGNIRDTLIALSCIPFAYMGGMVALLSTGTVFGISAGVGFIILFGVGVLDGSILISVIKNNLQKRMTLHDAIHNGVYSRIRPVVMLALMGALGLLPAALSTGMGSEIQKPIAIMSVIGMMISMVFTLLILPLIFHYAYKGDKKIRSLQQN